MAAAASSSQKLGEHMNTKYIPQDIEPKWHKSWAESGLYVTREVADRPKWYFLTMLPYPSGDLHIGHWYAMTPSDAGARYKRMKGYNVFFPIGFDAFGLPAENAAIRHGTHPYTWTMENIERMRGQLRTHGRDVVVGARSGQLRPGVLQVVAVVLPEAVRPGPGVPQEEPGRLLPELQHDPGARAGRRR